MGVMANEVFELVFSTTMQRGARHALRLASTLHRSETMA